MNAEKFFLIAAGITLTLTALLALFAVILTVVSLP